MEREDWETAAFWYEAALGSGRRDTAGGFVREDCHGYIPHMQLCVCCDRMGKQREAYRHHLEAKRLRPESDQVKYNEEYFRRLEV